MMNDTVMKYGLILIKALLTLAFVAAGVAKLAGVEMMVQTFDGVGIGQWFRYVTGLIEVGSAVLLWVPGLQIVGAGLLICTMIGAAITDQFILHHTPVPALVLLILAAVVAYAHRPAARV